MTRRDYAAAAGSVTVAWLKEELAVAGRDDPFGLRNGVS
jgi:hypothetical protein